MNQFFRTHRTFGYFVGTAVDEDGTPLTLLRTGPHHIEAVPAHLLMPVSEAELAFEARVQLIAAIEKARFLGLDRDALRAAFDEALLTL